MFQTLGELPVVCALFVLCGVHWRGEAVLRAGSSDRGVYAAHVRELFVWQAVVLARQKKWEQHDQLPAWLWRTEKLAEPHVYPVV